MVSSQSTEKNSSSTRQQESTNGNPRRIRLISAAIPFSFFLDFRSNTLSTVNNKPIFSYPKILSHTFSSITSHRHESNHSKSRFLNTTIKSSNQIHQKSPPFRMYLEKSNRTGRSTCLGNTYSARLLLKIKANERLKPAFSMLGS